MKAHLLALLAMAALPGKSIAQPSDDSDAIQEILAEALFQVQVADSRLRRDMVYPEALDPDHPIHAEVERMWVSILHTDNNLIYDPDAPFKVYEMAAKRLGIKPRMRLY